MIAAPLPGSGGCLCLGDLELQPRIIDNQADQGRRQRFDVPLRPNGGDVREEFPVFSVG